MLYSRLSGYCRRALPLLLVAPLYACGAGGQGSDAPESAPANVVNSSANADISVTEASNYQLALAVSDGGFVINKNVTLLCSEQFSYCSTEVEAGSVETLHAISRFDYAFSGWGTFTAPTIDLTVDSNTQINASFEAIHTTDAIAAGSCESSDATAFRALHLGDSLTLGPTWATESIAYAPEPGSIAYYEQKAGSHVNAPMVLAVYGQLVAGYRNGDIAQALSENHFWKQAAAEQNATVDQFNAVVVALGSNDAVDVIDGLDADFVIEHRIKPLLQWIGNKPVYWILPHYARWPTAMQNIRFSSSQSGLDCRCNRTSPRATAQCNIVDEMQSCSVDPDLQQQTIKAFQAIHALRQRIAALQDEYDNLIVVDSAQSIAVASNGEHDLYATMSPAEDTIHFSTQGSEWYGWLHAWLAMHGDSGCNLPSLPKWQMTANEMAMAANLDATSL